jgi:hypothetical protein
MSKLRKFDAAEYLDTPERQAAYLAAAMETGDADRSALEPCKSLNWPGSCPGPSLASQRALSRRV